MDVDSDEYYLHRIMECVAACRSGEDVQENTKLGIQLFNIFRVKADERLQTKGKPPDGTGSEGTAVNNISPPGGGVGGDSDTRERIPNGAP